LQSEQFKPAYEQLSRSLDLDRQQPEVQLLAGTVAMQLGNTEQAAQHYSMATGLSPREPRYLVHLALAYLKLGQTDRARDTFLGAIRVDSSCHAAFKGLADLYAQQNKLDLALGQIQNAIDAASLEEVEACLADTAAFEAMDVRVNRAANEEGVTGTPTFKVNGVKVRTPPTGEMDLATLDAAIAAAR
jgi:tetratricopeptide (TPR) repeat protein